MHAHYPSIDPVNHGWKVDEGKLVRCGINEGEHILEDL